MRRRGLVAGALVSLLTAALYLYRPAGLADLDQRTYDLLLGWTERAAPSGRVVIVDLDERSLAQFGRWPWPRSRLAGVLGAVRARGAAAIGLDMMFPEPDETPGADAALAAVLGEGAFVIGHQFAFDPLSRQDRACVLHPAAFAMVEASGGGPGPPALYRASTVICSLEGLAAAAGHSGFLNAAPDGDGVLRRIPLIIEYGGRVYPSLALATVMRAAGHRQLTLERAGSGSAWLRLGETRLPIDARGHLLVRFRGRRGTIPYVSAADVVADRLPAGALRDKIVLVGTSALGLRETVSTPLDPVVPGVEVQATVADNILAGDPVSRPGPASAVELALVLAVGPAAGVLLAGTWWTAGLLVALTAGLWWAAVWALGSAGTFVSPVFPTIALGAGATLTALLGFVAERRRADRTGESLALARRLVLHALTSLTEIRDQETGAHLLRTQHYIRVLCRTLARHPRFRDVLTGDTIELLANLAPIHDIGKVGVPDRLLRKPGPLTAEEYAEMQKHPVYGRDVIARAQARVGIGDETLIRLAKDIVYSHHERWDGAGYPLGLAGDAIPVAGRLIALVDVYDALVSERVYKRGWPHEEVVELIEAGRGTQFDPDVVDAFLRVRDEWRRISIEFADQPEPPGVARPTGTPAP